jgi:hypothetical protein
MVKLVKRSRILRIPSMHTTSFCRQALRLFAVAHRRADLAGAVFFLQGLTRYAN